MMHCVMWPFTRKETRDTCRTLAARLDDVESRLKLLTGEWNDVLDRLDRMVGRVVKRAQRDGAPSLIPPADGGPVAPAAAVGAAMAQVLARRLRKTGPAGG